jgi:hypothetical protein
VLGDETPQAIAQRVGGGSEVVVHG